MLPNTPVRPTNTSVCPGAPARRPSTPPVVPRRNLFVFDDPRDSAVPTSVFDRLGAMTLKEQPERPGSPSPTDWDDVTPIDWTAAEQQQEQPPVTVDERSEGGPVRHRLPVFERLTKDKDLRALLDAKRQRSKTNPEDLRARLDAKKKREEDRQFSHFANVVFATWLC